MDKYMEKSIVLEIQRMATENKEDISDLLRKAFLVATKLKLTDFRDWVDKELNGYRKGPVPEYRGVKAKVWLKNPYHGLIPVVFQSKEIANVVCNIYIRDPIGNLVSILEKQSKGMSDPIYPLTPEQEHFLITHQDGIHLPPIRTVSVSALSTIIDIVRTQILNWSLKLEEKGVHGKGMTFSNDEREIAVANKEINIQNFQGVLGDVNNSSLTQNLNMSIKANDFDSLKSFLLSAGLNEDDVVELEDLIQIDPKPVAKNKFGDKVSGWMGKMLTKAANGSWQISAGAAGNLLAQAISAYYGF